ncbi:MAG: VCBS repeat-containing protein [Armatimonadia bacterium]
MLRLCAVLCLALPSLCPAAQIDEFSQPVRLTYGDPATVAPAMGPCLTMDWDRDGRLDLVSGGSWWRSAGTGPDGVSLWERGGTGGIGAVNLADLNGNGLLDVVQGAKDGFHWREETSSTGPRSFVDRGKLQFVLGGDLAGPERGESAPVAALADWDRDGLVDLLVTVPAVGLESYLPSKGPGFGVGWVDGTWIFRDMTSTIYWMRNVGTLEKPVFTAGNLVTTGDMQRAITFFDRAQPFPIDWNDDGKTDLLVCTFDRVVVFLNVGRETGVPVLDEGHLLTFGGERNIPYERKTVCAFRQGERGPWCLRFSGPTASEAVQLTGTDPFAFGPVRMMQFKNPDMVLDSFAVPEAADWDGDGKLDLVVGCEDGWVWFFRNLDPSGGVSRWAAPRLLEADGKPIRLDQTYCLQGPCEWRWGYSGPAVIDWDLDGDLDLICGSSAETYVWFENVGSRTTPRLVSRGPLVCWPEGKPVSCAWRTRPGVGDLNGDKLPDLVGVNGDRQLCWWPRVQTAQAGLQLGAPQVPTDAEGKPWVITGAVRATGRSVLSVCDWDHDGRPDLLSAPPLGDRTGFQLLFHNTATDPQNPSFELRNKQVRVSGHISEGWNHYLMLEPVDWDKDGEWEAVAGVDSGAMYYWDR